MSFIKAGEISVHYDLTGPAGAPVVMLANSLGTNFHIWDPQARSLAERFRVLRYDMRGHGLTDCPEAGYGIDRLADDALALLDALGIDRVHFCGLSIGGMVGQRLAAKAGKRLRSLVLCDTASRIGPPSLWDDRIANIRANGLAAAAPGVLQRWFTQRFLAERPDEARGYGNMLARTPLAGYLGCCAAIRDADLRADDAAIRCPTLVIVGKEDLATPPAAAAELRDAIAGARLVEIDAAAHIPTIERPDAVIAALTEFLAGAAG